MQSNAKTYTPHPKAIAMWDFSWLERRWHDGGYEDWGLALDELAERGYDAVRIDAFPHLIAVDPTKEFLLKPVWNQHDWGSPTEISISVLPALTDFISLAKERNITVGLSSWFREDEDNVRLQLRTPKLFAEGWVKILKIIEKANLLDAIWYVDLCNEWANPTWAAYVYGWGDEPEPKPKLRSGDDLKTWTAQSLAVVKDAYPELSFCFSFSDQLRRWRDEDVRDLDFLEPHIWMAHETESGFYHELNYDMRASLFDPEQYRLLGKSASKLYESNRQKWRNSLREKISDMADWSRNSGLALVTTECWAIVNWKDGDDLSWDWVKELCAFGVEEAIKQKRWIGIATSNFCGPQYKGMWSDIDWHLRLTNLIKESDPDV